MERGEIKGSVCVPVLKKYEERRSVRRRHQQEGAKRQTRIQKKLTKMRNSCDKPKPGEVKDRVADAGSKGESLAWPAGQGSSRDKPRPDEVNSIVVDSGSKEESMAQPAGEGRRRMQVTQEMVDFIVGVEVVHYMLGEPVQPVPADTTPEFDFGVSDLLMEDIEEDAYVLRLYRTNKHSEFLINEDAELVSRRE